MHRKLRLSSVTLTDIDPEATLYGVKAFMNTNNLGLNAETYGIKQGNIYMRYNAKYAGLNETLTDT